MKKLKRSFIVSVLSALLVSPSIAYGLLIDTTYYVDINSSSGQSQMLRLAPTVHTFKPYDAINLVSYDDYRFVGVVEDATSDYSEFFAQYNPFIGETANSVFDVSAMFRQVSTITNNTDVAQQLHFNLVVNEGFISTGRIRLEEDDYLLSGFSSNVLVNDQSLWNTDVKIMSTVDRSELLQSGTALSGNESLGLAPNMSDMSSIHSFAWESFQTTLPVIALGIGESFTFEYNLYAFVEGQLGNCDRNCYRFSHAAINAPTFFEPFSSHNIVMTAITDGLPIKSVPEPGMLLLLLTGLLGMIYQRHQYLRR